nr:MAG: replication associated protein [Virus sp.]
MTQSIDSGLPGNTNTGRQRSRAYMITIYEDPLVHFDKAVYECWCDDTCKDGKPHKHQLVCFKNQVSWRTIKKAYPTSHIEKAHCVHDCIEYISDTTKRKFNFEERGKRPVDTRFKSTKELLDVSDVSEVPWQQVNTWNKLREKKRDLGVFQEMLTEIEHDELVSPKIVYITGGTGKGKTYGAYKMALKRYPKEKIGKITLKNEFVDVLNEDADCFVIEEFRPSQIRASDFLQLTDKYGYRCNVKGGFATIRPKALIICSIIPPTEIYKEEVNQQFMRRITRFIDLGRDMTPEEELTEE